jgi:exosortase/archaeosortase family protein
MSFGNAEAGLFLSFSSGTRPGDANSDPGAGNHLKQRSEGERMEATALRATRVSRLPLERIPVRAIGLVASVTLAYNYSLQTLTRGLGLQTPLAYLALVPPIALLLGAANFKLHPNLRPINDRQLDWIIGLFLISFAAVITLFLPSAYSADFWLHRLDMIGLPFFTAGLVSLLYGVRRLWSMRWAIAFLLLAWPDPYVSVLSSAIGTSTDIALAVVTASLHVFPVAQPLGDGTFLINYAGGPFSLSVGSACSGINSLVGFLILGGALNTIFTGSLWRRVLWMIAGMMVVGFFNVIRIDMIFVAGLAAGEPFAIDVLHPVAGIIVFGVGALAMLGLAPWFGLSIPQAPRDELPADEDAAPRPPLRERMRAMATRVKSAASGPATGRPAEGSVPDARRSGATRRPAYSVAVALALGLMLAVPNAGFAHYDSLVDAFGTPTLGAIDPSTVAVPGWSSSPPVGFAQATQYFGSNGTWDRLAFSAKSPSSDGLSSVYLDVIRTDDSGSLASYGIEACYNFHGFTQVSNQTADVGAGVDAKMASFRSPDGGTDWSILWWEWPYNAGGQTRFERLVLLIPLNEADQPGGSTSQTTFQAAQLTLTTMAHEIVAQAIGVTAPTLNPATQQ